MSQDWPSEDRFCAHANQLDRLVSLSERMLGLARAGRWEDVAQAEVERQAALRRLGDITALAPDDPGVQLIRERLQAILDLNAEAMRLGGAVREALAAQIRTLNEGRLARRAYLENEG